MARKVAWTPIPALAARHRIGLWLGLGVALRAAQYLAGRMPWMDETSLAANIVGRPLASLFGPLDHTQLAPPGFLVVEWIASRWLGPSAWSLRLVPLLAGVASLFLFERYTRRVLGPTAAWVALGMFALSDDLIYYASELKQYSSDVMIAIACALMGRSMAGGPATAGRLAGFAATGAAAVWFSHPSLFVLASAGVVAFADAMARRAWGRAAGLAAVGAAWLASFAGVHAVALRQLGHRDSMWRFWGGTFPPEGGPAWDRLAWPARKALYLFVNPLDFALPIGPLASALAVAALFAIGCASIGRRDGRALAGLLLPIGLALLASWLREYPTHGRTALFLAPFLLAPIAEGAAWLRDRGARGLAWRLVLAALFLGPGLGAAYRLAVPRDHNEFNPYGDRRPASLDPIRFAR